MPLHLDPTGENWHLDFTIAELLAAIRRHDLPKCLERTATGNVPGPLMHWCESVPGTQVWPLQNDFVPVWTTNVTTCLAYEPSITKFTYQHIEQVAEGSSRVFDSFSDVAAWVLLDLIGGDSDEDIRVAAKFFDFSDVVNLLNCNSIEEYNKTFKRKQ